MALFVLIIVGVVVAQTWLDWRDTRKNWHIPNWAKGTALAGVVAVSLAAATSIASVWLQEPASQTDNGIEGRLFWPELGFLVCMTAIVVFSVRKQRLRLMLLLTAVVVMAFWIGMSLFS
jgi:hypothetical protein